ncbi:hypothetical protein D9758_001579 [Tetrapyrgos nigripes]|uniref:Signal recognition particle subunit SRP72 n=1 Tax=Tetrapyrgos nigripes TaxID=182062 RepID=A0A8H5LWQ1_9AGAR|nr:hypothetical protein D9758_001579 [Tetrapyrgos nigripes]
MSSKPKPKSHKGKRQTTKPAQKRPLPVPERIKRHFSSLCAQIDGGHFANAIKTCDKILRLDPNDQDALRTKLFLYLQTEQYLPSLDMIESESGDEHAFEKAYAFYRLQQEDEASAVLEDIKKKKGGDDRGVMHLEAQLSYRQGSYQSACDLYNQLLDTAEPQSEEYSDIVVNLQAAQQHLDFINSGYLQGIDSLPSNLRNSIESQPPPAFPSSTSAAAIIASSNQAADSAQPAQKKVRAKRVPKGVIPGVTPPPDPERWLKKSERTTVSFGKKRKGAGGGASQGATQGANVDAHAPSGGGGGGSGGGGGGKKGKKRK